MDNLANKKILLGVCGGIAAYKTPDIVRRLREQGAEVRVVMTEAAKQFITLLTLQAVSGHPVYEDLWDPQALASMAHIELARFADLIVIAPATADIIASMAHGFADDLLSSLCLASEAEIVIAPAMNQKMWQHPATQANVQCLQERGVRVLGPDVGSQACGEFGPGRLLESDDLVKQIVTIFTPNSLLSNVRVVITAGPTQEPIDPVRYLSNHSSGKMGYALAEAAANEGAKVVLISGPVALQAPHSVKIKNVVTASDMYTAVMDEVKQCDLFISTAAVSDYRSEDSLEQKQSKSSEGLTLKLVANPDILKEVAAMPRPPFTIGFAAETHNVIEHAKKKLIAKRLAMIIANEVGKNDRGFSSNENAVTVIWPKGERHYPLTPKRLLAKELITIIAEHFHAKSTT
jgi:phosphopantothenoylcysteine decarboxylase/phosphopantothenate--cysteine ligase